MFFDENKGNENRIKIQKQCLLLNYIKVYIKSNLYIWLIKYKRMKVKIIGIIGLLFIVIGQTLLYQGFDFLNAQKPIDFAHWFLLIGASMTIAISFALPKSIFNTIATALTILGIIGSIGMCAIDFTFWSFGTDNTSRNELIGHLMNTPSVWYPFFVIGPSLLYIGLATQAWQFIKSHTTYALITIGGSFLLGFGQFMLTNRIWALIGTIIFSLGLVLLIFREEKKLIE
jgi:hypothetical protein